MYSFDVYDTIITRKVFEPYGIWELMSYCIMRDTGSWELDASFVYDFACIRANAEKQARKQGQIEITLDDIYNEMQKNYGLSDTICSRLKQLEMQCELDNTIANKNTIKKILDLHKSGEHIVLISDMYLPKEFFQKLFDKICPTLNEIKLYLSCDIGFTKSSGLLYEYVSKCEGTDYCNWVHEGDNIVSDINIPELYGISTVEPFWPINKDISESLRKVSSNKSSLTKQIVMGLLKNVDGNRKKGYYVGYAFSGIVLFDYVNWVLKQASSRKIKRLFFIARDGYILKKIADVIINNNDLNTETFYLYGSRNAWRVEEQEKKDIVLKYLNQEFSNNYENVALVDTQGTGTSIELLSNICGTRLTVFYYSLIENVANKNINPISYTSWIGGSIIEALCRAPHGYTRGYESYNGEIVPVLEESNKYVFDKAELIPYLDGVEQFAKDFSIVNSSVTGELPTKSFAEDVLSYCLMCEDKNLADFFGEIPFDTNNYSENTVYAPKLTKEDIRKIELDRTTECLKTVYSGEALDVSYNRLNHDEKLYLKKCKQKYLDKTIYKSENAINVVIYGFGAYGKELYHRLLMNPEVMVVAIVDANHQKFVEGPKVEPLKTLKEISYERIVISLCDRHIAEQICNMLVSAGVKREKISFCEEFEQSYMSN